jgi:hypothetical protein
MRPPVPQDRQPNEVGLRRPAFSDPARPTQGWQARAHDFPRPRFRSWQAGAKRPICAKHRVKRAPFCARPSARTHCQRALRRVARWHVICCGRMHRPACGSAHGLDIFGERFRDIAGRKSRGPLHKGLDIQIALESVPGSLLPGPATPLHGGVL